MLVSCAMRYPGKQGGNNKVDWKDKIGDKIGDMIDDKMVDHEGRFFGKFAKLAVFMCPMADESCISNLLDDFNAFYDDCEYRKMDVHFCVMGLMTERRPDMASFLTIDDFWTMITHYHLMMKRLENNFQPRLRKVSLFFMYFTVNADLTLRTCSMVKPITPISDPSPGLISPLP